MSDVPKWVTLTGHALAERQRRETRLREEMLYVILDNPNARWTTTANKIARLTNMPRWGRQFLLQAEVEDSYDDAARLARTVATASFNADSLTLMALHNLPYKMWVTRRDAKVRETHKAMDGTKVALSKPFVVDGSLMQYACDGQTAPPSLWMGCRCVVVGRKRP